MPDPATGLCRWSAQNLRELDALPFLPCRWFPQARGESVRKNLKIYQLSDAANPPATTFANASGVPTNFVAPCDDSFWTLLNQVIKEDPPEGVPIPPLWASSPRSGLSRANPSGPTRA